MKRTFAWVAAAVCAGVVSVIIGCSSSTNPMSNTSTSTQNTNPPPTPNPNLSITDASVKAAGRSGGGFNYTFSSKVSETNNWTATITGVDASVSSDSSTLASSHYGSADLGALNVQAGGSISLPDLVLTDTNPAHGYATTFRIVITYASSTGASKTTQSSANTPTASSLGALQCRTISSGTTITLENRSTLALTLSLSGPTPGSVTYNAGQTRTTTVTPGVYVLTVSAAGATPAVRTQTLNANCDYGLSVSITTASGVRRVVIGS